MMKAVRTSSRTQSTKSISQVKYSQGESTMKPTLFNLSTKAGQLNAQHVRLALAVGTLILFVLGAGAPGAGGDF
jgi:hypothetical protein